MLLRLGADLGPGHTFPAREFPLFHRVNLFGTLMARGACPPAISSHGPPSLCIAKQFPNECLLSKVPFGSPDSQVMVLSTGVRGLR